MLLVARSAASHRAGLFAVVDDGTIVPDFSTFDGLDNGGLLRNEWTAIKISRKMPKKGVAILG
jgi:hypothetical protein